MSDAKQTMDKIMDRRIITDFKKFTYRASSEYGSVNGFVYEDNQGYSFKRVGFAEWQAQNPNIIIKEIDFDKEKEVIWVKFEQTIETK